MYERRMDSTLKRTDRENTAKGRSKLQFKSCRVVLPVLSMPFVSTVKLCSSNNRNNTHCPTSDCNMQSETVRKPIYLGKLIIGYENLETKKELIAKKKEEEEEDEAYYGDLRLDPVVIPQKSFSFVNSKGERKTVDLESFVSRKSASGGTEKVIRTEVDNYFDRRVSKPEDNYFKEISDRKSVDFKDVTEQTLVNQVDSEEELFTPIYRVKVSKSNHQVKTEEVKPRLPGQPESVDASNVNVPVNCDINSNSVTRTKLQQALKRMRNDQRKSIAGEQDIRPEIMLVAEIESIDSSKRNDELKSNEKLKDVDTSRKVSPIKQKGLNTFVKLVDFKNNRGNNSKPAKDPTNLQNKNKFCNICGSGVESNEQLSSFLELNEETKLKRFMCLTCHQWCSPLERSRHRAECFLLHKHVYYDGWEDDLVAKRTGEKFTMWACRNCVDSFKQL